MRIPGPNGGTWGTLILSYSDSGHPPFSQVDARKLLDKPDEKTLEGLRDRAILAVGLQVGLRRAEIVNALFIQGNAKAMVDLARKETNPEMKKMIVSKLSIMGSKDATEYMLELLSK